MGAGTRCHPDAGRLVDTGLAQPAQASLNALFAVTGALIEHGLVPGNACLVATFLALHELRVRAIALLNQTEDRAAPPAASRPGEPPGA